MYRDFDDFEDEHQHIRAEHYQNLDQDQYGDDYDPNDESFYDLDVFSVDYAKALFHGLGDIAKYKGFNRVGEDIPLEDYFDDQGNSVALPQDNPHDLYHSNNHTILDASTMPDAPVDPQTFVEKVSAELTANKVLISNEMPDLLDRMCRLFNFSIQPNQELPRTIKNLVFPAQTGIGKSVSLQVYVSMLEKHSSIIVVAKVEEAINYCRYINDLSGDENYARCYYSLTDKNKDDPMRVEVLQLRKHRCIVITHSMFRRVNGFEEIEYFSEYQGKPRDFIVIDEKLSFYEQYKLGYKELDTLIENVKEALEQSKQLKELTTSHEVLELLTKFKEFLLIKDDKIITDSNSIVIKEYSGKDLQTELNSIDEQLEFSEYSTEFPKKIIGLKNKEAVLQKLQSLNIPTQARKRMVIGVPFTDVFRLSRGLLTTIEPYYCEKLDPKLGNCKAKSEVIQDQSIDLDDEESFLAVLKDVELMKNQAKEDSQNGVFYEDGLKLASSIIKVLLEVRVDELLDSLEKLGANKNATYKQNILNKIDELIMNLSYFAINHFLIYKTNYETALLATQNITNQLGLSVVLDATAQINEYYKLANRFLGHVGFVTAPQIRQYENLTIHKAIGFNQSRSAIYKGKESNQLEAIAKSYASYALNELDKDDKMLIICHKDFKSSLAKQVNDSRVKFTHWGDHVGRNEWSDCNKVMVIGWYYLNQIEYVSTINSSLESVLLTSRHLDEGLIEKFQISQLADDMVQGLMRSQARVIATKESDCKPTSFYIFYDGDDKSKEVIELVESQFPKANIVDWIPNGVAIPKKKTKRNKKEDSIIELLVEKVKNHETYLRADVEKELEINKSTMTRIIDGDDFKNKLAEHGFTFKNKDGKSQQFILK